MIFLIFSTTICKLIAGKYFVYKFRLYYFNIMKIKVINKTKYHHCYKVCNNCSQNIGKSHNQFILISI